MQSRSEPKQRVEGEWDGGSAGSDEIIIIIIMIIIIIIIIIIIMSVFLERLSA